MLLYSVTSIHTLRDQEPTRKNQIDSSPELFDGQAGFFERRAGLPEACCRAIAKKVIEIGEAKAGELIVEIGSGTGQIGQWFEPPVRYAGFDLSAGMLKECSRRLDFIQTDANASWPLVDGAARVIFSSRAVHLLRQEHVAHEVFRVASSAGATLILGRVERKPESVRARMAQEMNERLRQHGFAGRRGERQNRKLFDLCCSRGAVALDPVAVAQWRVLASPRQSLDSWHSLIGLGGVPVPAPTRAEILRELEDWATEAFGGLDQEFESEETYVLKSLRLPSNHGA